MIGSIACRTLSSDPNESPEELAPRQCARATGALAVAGRSAAQRRRAPLPNPPEVPTAMPQHTAERLTQEWASGPRWRGIRRDYGAEAVLRLRTVVQPEHTLARHGAERLWALLAERDHLPALRALTGGQAGQMVKAGLEAIYLSGWQVAADANLADQVYPDQSLYPANSVPTVVRRINNALLRAEQIARVEGADRRYLAPIVADAEAGFGGPLNAYE